MLRPRRLLIRFESITLGSSLCVILVQLVVVEALGLDEALASLAGRYELSTAQIALIRIFS